MNHPDRSAGESPEFLRRTPAEIRTEQSRLLRDTLGLVRQAHPHYRERWSELGIDPAAVTGVDDIQALPLTRKTDFMSSPESFRLELSGVAGLPVEKRLLWEVMYTTGTSSGSPSALYTTSHDHFSGLYAARMVAEFHGITERDVVANLYPLTSMPMGAFIRATDLAFAAGASALALFPGKPYPEFDVHRRLDETIAMVAEHRATVLVGVATFMRRFVLRAEELGVDLSSVRRVLLGGEAAPLPIRADIERRLQGMGASEVWVTSRYGSTEMGTLPECATGSGWHNPAPDLLYLEIVDDDGNPLPDGDVGQLAVTHLNKTGTVLIRYLVGDVTSMSHEPCPHCGRTGGRIVEQPRRVSPLVKVRGMLVNPVLVNQAVATIDGIEDHQVVVDKNDPDDPLSMDSFTVRVIPRGEMDAALLSSIENLVREAVGITPEIEICRAEDIFDPHARTKPLRFVDRRGEAQTRADAAREEAVTR
jgi:phenylacetate-coenzyme A ligase PaaK-like adenylate-forming protein